MNTLDLILHHTRIAGEETQVIVLVEDARNLESVCHLRKLGRLLSDHVSGRQILAHWAHVGKVQVHLVGSLKQG